MKVQSWELHIAHDRIYKCAEVQVSGRKEESTEDGAPVLIVGASLSARGASRVRVGDVKSDPRPRRFLDLGVSGMERWRAPSAGGVWWSGRASLFVPAPQGPFSGYFCVHSCVRTSDVALRRHTL